MNEYTRILSSAAFGPELAGAQLHHFVLQAFKAPALILQNNSASLLGDIMSFDRPSYFL